MFPSATNRSKMFSFIKTVPRGYTKILLKYNLVGVNLSQRSSLGNTLYPLWEGVKVPSPQSGFSFVSWPQRHPHCHSVFIARNFSPIIVPLQSATTVTLPSSAGIQDHNPFPGAIACISGFDDVVSLCGTTFEQWCSLFET